MKMKKILITGNLGYVGPVLTKKIKNDFSEYQIIGFDSGYFLTNITSNTVVSDILVSEQYFGDIRNFPVSILKDVESVIHLAAISNDPMSNSFEEVTYDINYNSSIKLAMLAKEAGVNNFIFASSCSVYGFAENGERVESSELNPLTAYAKSKVLTEKALIELADKDFKITCLRFATACGASDRLRLDLVINDFVASAISNNKISILSDGSPWRPLINVKDMARAISWAISRNNGGEYLVVNTGSNDWNFQVKDIAYRIKEILPGTIIDINSNAQPDKRSYKVDFSLFHELAPEAYPKITINETINELIEKFNSINFKDANFRNSNFVRLNMINSLKNSNQLDNTLYWNHDIN